MKKAICIGLNYPGSQYQLGGCVNDAQMLSDRMYAKGASVKMVRDYMAADQFLSLLAEAGAAMKKSDTLYVSYSGHGTQFQQNRETHEGLCFWNGKHIEVLTDADLNKAIDAIPGTVVLILDSCFSGGMDRDVKPPTSNLEKFVAFDPNAMSIYWSPVSSKAINIAPTKRINLFACSKDEVSYDLGTNGLFTAQFLKAYDAGAKTVSALMRKALAGCKPNQYPTWTSRGVTGAKRLF